MRYELAVTSSNSINRYGYRFSVGALISAAWDCCGIGVPVLTSHDFSRPLGWGYPLALHIEPGLARSVDRCEMVETEEDAEFYFEMLKRRHLKAYEESRTEIEILRELISRHLRGQEKIICEPYIAFVEPDLAVRVFPKPFSYADHDRDGLVGLDKLSSIGPGVFAVGKLVLFAHCFFRRSLFRLNSLNLSFLRHIQILSDNGVPVKIALDRDMVGLVSTHRESEELQYWWGPKFNDDISAIPPGVTCHRASENERIFFGISRTEFWWQPRNSEYTFEAEELRDIPTPIASGQYGCRYVHAIGKQAGTIVHFDGAVRTYSDEEMLLRLDKDIMHAGRHTKYVKLWRIDGEITIPVWKSLLSDYFRDNPLVGEYLGGSDDASEHSDSRSRGEETPAVSKYVPYSMVPGMGIRIAISFRPRSSFVTAERQLIPAERLALRSHDVSVAEAEAIELQKALKRHGTSILMPSDIRFVKFRDRYTNFPPVLHASSELESCLQKTFEGLGSLVHAWHTREDDRVVSFSIGFPLEDKDVWVSVLGHVADVEEWFLNPLCKIPTALEAFRNWTELVTDFLESNYPHMYDSPSLRETMTQSGTLSIQRKFLENVEHEFRLEDNHILINMVLPENENELREMVADGSICPAISFIVLASTCSRCGSEYRECLCSKLLDQDVVEEITELEPVTAFWTDRPL